MPLGLSGLVVELRLLKGVLFLWKGNWDGESVAYWCHFLLFQPAGDSLCECNHGGSSYSTGTQIPHQGKLILGHRHWEMWTLPMESP